jgi:photosystem II stability/assembly factor-like uncharacterized protein
VQVITVGSSGSIRYSINSGLTWSSATSSTSGNINSISQYNNSLAMIAGDSSYVARTSDGGLSWTSLTVFSTSVNIALHSMSLISATEAYVAGQDGEVYKTVDFGTSWSIIASTNTAFYSLSFYDASTAVAGASSGVYVLVSSKFTLSLLLELLIDIVCACWIRPYRSTFRTTR